MAQNLYPGQRIETRRLGPGTVVKPTLSGALIRLDRMMTTVIELPIAQIDGGTEVEVRPEPPPRPAQSRPVSEEKARARRSIEALRFGIVPMSSLEDVTVGFSELQSWVDKNLPHNRGGGSHVSEISGAFGTGKSHTMAAIRVIAHEQGYLTAHVEVNGSDVTLSDPEGVLRQLWPTVAGAELESASPVLELHVQALDNGLQAAKSALRGFERIQENLGTVSMLRGISCLDQNSDDLDVFLSCGDAQTASALKGQIYRDVVRNGGNWATQPFEVKRLIGQRVEDRPTDFVNCLLGYSLLGRRAGFKGLVITIDEFEVEVYSLTSSKLERVEALADALADQLGPQSAPVAVFVATVGDHGHAGDEIVADLVEQTGGDIYHLPKWTAKSMRELARLIHRLYCVAYDADGAFNDREVAAIDASLDDAEVESSGVVRAFIKAYVAKLDTTYGPVPV